MFYYLSGIYGIAAQDIVVPNEQAELSRRGFGERDRAVRFDDRTIRTLVNDPLYVTHDNTWVIDRTLHAHGYSTADSPLYWYLKNDPFLKQLAGFAQRTVYRPEPAKIPGESDNDFLDRLAKEVADLVTGTVIVDQIPKPGRPDADAEIVLHEKRAVASVLAIEIANNSFVVEVDSESQALLYITDKYYPGWVVSIDGQAADLIVVNYLFKGVLVPEGRHVVDFRFVPASFYLGLLVSLCFITGLLMLIVRGRKLAELDKEGA